MACYHPLKGFLIGKTENGKDNYKICSYGVDHCEETDQGKIITVDTPGRSSFARRSYREWIEIPCGKCVGCRLAYSRAWANRCMLELQDHKSSYFLTLTYDDDHLPITYYGSNDTGEAIPAATLRKKDLQDFHKRLRFAVAGSGAADLRFYACGEYGDQTFRPHYHDIVFGLTLDDLVWWSRSELGYDYYTSEFLSSIWKHGRVIVGEVTWDTCAYTARYVMKKLKGDLAVKYEEFNIEPPFVLMSRRPGIARNYYETHPELFDKKCIYLATDSGSRPVYPPKYYKRLFDIDEPEKSAIMKERNKQTALVNTANKLKQTDLGYLDLLSVEEAASQRKVNALIRKEF